MVSFSPWFCRWNLNRSAMIRGSCFKWAHRTSFSSGFDLSAGFVGVTRLLSKAYRFLRPLPSERQPVSFHRCQSHSPERIVRVDRCTVPNPPCPTGSWLTTVLAAIGASHPRRHYYVFAQFFNRSKTKTDLQNQR